MFVDLIGIELRLETRRHLELCRRGEDAPAATAGGTPVLRLLRLFC
jgi:hypothetical protein